jgi:hypothetical protein
MFWEYLMWSASPIPLIFAVLGLRDMLPARRWLFATFAAWSLPVMAFYFPAATQPRYFLLTTLPVAIATAVGMASVAKLAGKWRTPALAAAIALCSVHLVVGLGHFGRGPGHERGYLREATLTTHTGPLWTGALLYKVFPAQGLASATVMHPRFGSTGAERSLTTMFAFLGSGAKRGGHVLLLYPPSFGSVTHFYAQAAGVRIVSKSGGQLRNTWFEAEIGGARLTMIEHRQEEPDSTSPLALREGDEVWLFADRNGSALSAVAARLEPGLGIVVDSQLTDAPDLSRARVLRGP